MNNKLKWAALQPLSGGAYFGTENVLGKPAEFIISFPGLEKIVYMKNGEISHLANERHVLEYLKKKKKLPPYFQFAKGMFEYEPTEINDVEFIDTEYTDPSWDKNQVYKGDLDLVVSVPVCSGLSAANCQDHGKEDSVKNNNMRFLANYALRRLKPKAYIFENAPGLYTSKGVAVRNDLNKLAKETGYAITYVHTDTHVHDNVQQRVRTFCIFWKGTEAPPTIGYESLPQNDVVEYLKRIPATATQNDKEFLANDPSGNEEYEFIKQKFGNTWRQQVGHLRFKSFILQKGLAEEFYQFHKNDKLKAHYDYCKSKTDKHMGYYDRSFFCCANDHMPTIYHGNTWSMIHPTEDRCFTFREVMTVMGMPFDYDYLHTNSSFGTLIGQNVPGRTIQFWIEEICKVLNDWDGKRKMNARAQSHVFFHDNLHQRNSHYEGEDKKKLQFGRV
jgi:site-specific DNA-cytosine methylase